MSNRDIFKEIDQITKNFNIIENSLKLLINNNSYKYIDTNSLSNILSYNMYIPNFVKIAKKNMKFNDNNNEDFRKEYEKIKNESAGLFVKKNNDDIKFHNEEKKDKLNKKISSQMKSQEQINPNLNMNNIFSEKDENEINNISKNINYGNNIFTINENKTEKSEINSVYNEIKQKINKYVKNNKKLDVKKQLSNYILENKNDQTYYNLKQETLCINNKMVCVIYLENQKIKKIFTINNGKTFEKEDDILYLLNQIKSDLEKNINN